MGYFQTFKIKPPFGWCLSSNPLLKQLLKTSYFKPYFLCPKHHLALLNWKGARQKYLEKWCKSLLESWSRYGKSFLRFLGKFLTFSTGVPQAATGTSRLSYGPLYFSLQARRALFQASRASLQLILRAFPVSELGARWLVGNMWKYNFQNNLNFVIWCPFDPSKIDFPNTGQNWWILVQKCIELFVDHFWMPSRCRNWTRDGSLERCGSLISRKTWIFSFGVHLSLQKLTVPSLVKNGVCWCRKT